MAEYSEEELHDLDREQLLDLPIATEITGRHKLRKDELVNAILEEQSAAAHPANVGAPDKPKVDLSHEQLTNMSKDELRDAADKAELPTTQRMTHDDLVTLLSTSTAVQTVTDPDEQLNPPRRSYHDGSEQDPALRSGLSVLPFKKREPLDHKRATTIGRGSPYDVGQYESDDLGDDDESA